MHVLKKTVHILHNYARRQSLAGCPRGFGPSEEDNLWVTL